MELTSYEKDILAGKYGEGMAYALEIQLAIGNAFDADRFVPITRTHVALSAQDADLWFAEKMLSKGAKCIIPPTVNPSINLKYLNDHLFEIPKAGKEIVSATNEAYRKLGAQLTFDCTPYLQQNVPAFGEVIAFSESSATPYVNSVIGARTNREGSNSALCAAITGVVPRYGLLLDGQCRTLADLPKLCDILADGTLVFDDMRGNLRQSRVYSLQELLALAQQP